MSSRLEEGDFRGAIRLASASDSLAPHSAATFRALQEKHPSPSSSSSPPLPASDSSFLVTELEVAKAISSFPQGSSGGPDNLRPQLLKDMLSTESQEPGHSRFLSSLAAFSSLVLEGRTPESVKPFFFGARLIALQKKGGRSGRSGRSLLAALSVDWLPRLLVVGWPTIWLIYYLPVR